MTLNIYKLEHINIYTLSKLLHFLGWEHEILINNDANIWRFDDTNVLIYTNVKVKSCNVNAIIVSDIFYNTNTLLECIQNIAQQNNIYVTLSDLQNVNTFIYKQYISEYTSPNEVYKPVNLPIALHILAKSNKYECLRILYTYKFKKIGMHTLAVVLYNIITNMITIKSPPKTHTSFLFENMIIY